jgi:hypothetical protein
MEPLRYDDEDVMRLKDGAATIHRISLTNERERLSAPRSGEWSAVEILAHVAAMAEVTRERLERCLRESAPRIDSVPSGAMLDERDPRALAKRIAAAHAAIVELMMEPGAAARPATHSEWGKIPAEHFAAYHARHADEHLRELAGMFPPR